MTLFETLFEIEEGKDPESKRCTMEVNWKKNLKKLQVDYVIKQKLRKGPCKERNSVRNIVRILTKGVIEK